MTVAGPATAGVEPAPVDGPPRATDASPPLDGGERATAAAAPASPRPAQGGSATTAAQLRRFIKSRTWVPMHELRRRFGINAADDDVTPVAVDGGTVYVGLPPREGELLGELLRGGEIGYELSLDPRTPIVVGVYPMRPVPRH